MSGKEKKAGWGGRREGAGRPRKTKTSSQKIKEAYVKACRELTKEFGESPQKAVLRLVYQPTVQDSVRVAALKCFNEAVLVKESERRLEIDRGSAPQIYLPEKRPDPAKLIPINGGKSEGNRSL